MIKTTNNVKSFIENEQGDIVVYGAGNSGLWVGSFLKKCDIDFLCYVDKNVSDAALFMNDKPVHSLSWLISYSNPCRIIVTPNCYKEVLTDIIKIDSRFEKQYICLIPEYNSITEKEEKYNINVMLAYFRRRLLKIELPVFISNNCVAGHIYELTNHLQISPTLNTGISPEDFIKLCFDIRYYLNKPLENIHMERIVYKDTNRIENYPAANVGDIKICFVHNYNLYNVEKRWRMLTDRLDYNNICFILSDNIDNIQIDLRRKFAELKNPHYFFRNRCAFIPDGNTDNCIFLPDYIFRWTDRVIENEFDLVDWINHIYD